MDESPPFTTATVARIYLEQGKLDQAEEIFHRVLAERPDDERSIRGLAEIERRRAANDEAESAADVVLLQAASTELVCYWRISPAGRRRAHLVAGEDGVMILRIVGFPTEADAPPVDAVLPAESGDMRMPLPHEDVKLVAAAVGLLTSSNRFVAIAHTELVNTP